MKALDVIFFASIAAGIIALPFWVIFAWPIWFSKSNQPPKRWRERIADASTVLFIAGVLIGLATAWTSQGIAHNEVVTKLKSISDDCSIAINEMPALNSKELLVVLRTLDRLPAHHSNPTKKITVNLSDGRSNLVLSLARDSGDPREYWVFYPKYFITKSNEIGRIQTSLLDGY